ncbi:hypothetical protein [Chromobacterium sp. CV08]|uniref:hypothetical protein n=1 Tax=Chromobacterium sp. CV08 TaxID=3133274 RepID=UPI003DA85190
MNIAELKKDVIDHADQGENAIQEVVDLESLVEVSGGAETDSRFANAIISIPF